MEKIVEQTNIYGEIANSDTPESSHMKKWQPTDTDEMYVFLAVSLLMPQVKKQRLKDYWSKDVLIQTSIFNQSISRDRYFQLLRNIHFSNNNTPDPSDRIFKIRCIIDHFRKTFRENMYLFENICIDESLMLFKGCISFRQYIPSKRHRFGIKFFVAVDCETGYVLDIMLYTGAATEINEYDAILGKSGNIVLEPYCISCW